MEVLLDVGAIFGGVGVIFLIVAIIMTSVKKSSDKRYSGRAYGVVVEIISRSGFSSVHSGMRSRRYYAPQIRYNVNGFDLFSHPMVFKYPCNYSVGQTVTVCYDPQNPEKMKIEGDKTVTILSIIFFIVSGILILLGGSLLVVGLLF